MVDGLNKDGSRTTGGLPRSVKLISHNLWLIPLKASYDLGRVDRCGRNLLEMTRAKTRDGEGLVLVAVQEAWAYRVGAFAPLYEGYAALERWAVGRFGLRGAGESVLAWLPRLLVQLLTVLQAFVPALRSMLYDPKRRLKAILQGELRWHSFEATRAFQRLPLFTRSPCLLDGGLYLAATQKPDACGYEAYGRDGSDEALAYKGMLWATFGRLAVINTHMTFQFNDGGRNRRAQQLQLAGLAKKLLETCEAVLLVGDFNHALPDQVTDGGPGAEPHGGSPTTYVRPWLPKDASVDHLTTALQLDGAATVRRLSSDDPTNLDGTVDHVFVVTKADAARSYDAAHAVVVPDDHAHVSDHLMITCDAVLRA